MRIVWFSNSVFAQTGYGNQTRLFTPLLKNLGHEIHIQAFFGHELYTAPINWNGMIITGRGFHPYGQDVIAQHALNVKADIVLSLLDAWVFDPNQVRQIRWCPWFPVDHDPIPPRVLSAIQHAFTRIVYSRFGEKQLNDRGMDCLYVPHGVDTNVFKPIHPSERIQARDIIGLPKDAFIVGMVAANKGYPGRKAFEENIAAFKLLKQKHSDAVLFLQTWTGEGADQAVDLVDYCKTIGLNLGKDVYFCDQFVNITTGFPDAYMVAMYNSLDVLLSVSRGEGFGIPIVEAQACGTPVIVGDWTSMPELCFAGWKVDKKDTVPDFTRQSSYQFIPSIPAIAEKLEAAYQMRGTPDYAKRARDGAEKYDVQRVTEKYWKPALETIAQKIEKIEKLRAQVNATPIAPAGPASTIEVKEITA
jgi:glycosyltransferase involved in cell wall biosynthesis